jgi:hypothetical protein
MEIQRVLLFEEYFPEKPIAHIFPNKYQANEQHVLF